MPKQAQVQEEKIIRTEYSEVMQQSYIDYAMSVIIARALPDVRDGLKPVQRRTLYDMHELGIRYDRPYRKCARIVGDTMGKYHPHGDSSIYDALVVMAQDFKKAIPLVDGHGNFGSIEGDGAAAMRYTEARLSKLTQEVFLKDLDKDVVDFMPNFDETEKEPVVLPVRISNLLVNGSEGIAVGMATNIPPHNLGEVADATIALINDDSLSNRELMEYIKGPDFPTGGIVVNQDELADIYENGTGKIRIRGRVDIEKGKGGKQQIVISEIPYTMIGSGIGKFLNDVASLVETKKTTDIADISNQSSKEGIRIVIELKKGADAENIVNLLYKKTRLEDTFGVNMLAVADGRPETLDLRSIIEYNVNFQFELANRKYTKLLAKEEHKKEIQEGLIKACDVIDLIIEILRGSKDLKEAKACLMHGDTGHIKFKSNISKKMAKLLSFTEAQAQAILEMRLYKLIGLEIEALMKEHEETLKNIAFYSDVLNNYDSMAKVIIDDLTAVKNEYAVPRKTALDNAEEVVIEEKAVEEEPVYFLMDRFGYCKTIDVPTYERNKEAAEGENRFCVPCLNTGKICVFTNAGKLHTIKTMDVPHGKLRDKGQPLDNISRYDSVTERVVFVCDQEQLRLGKLLFASKEGMLKQVEASQLMVSKTLTAATKLADDDELAGVGVVQENSQLILKTHDSCFLRFEAKEVPEKGKTAVGVKGIRLGKGDYVTDLYIVNELYGRSIKVGENELAISRIRPAKRGAKGTKIKLQ